MRLICLAVLLVQAAFGQSGVYGFIRNRDATPLPGADVLVQSEASGARWKTTANAGGRYAVSALPSGRYKVTARLAGFRTVTRVGIVLEEQRGEPLDFEMDLTGLHQMITVVGARDDIDPSSGDSLLLTREGTGATLPVNGRDFRSSFDVMPGVAIVPAAVSDAGQFTSNGQRPSSHRSCRVCRTTRRSPGLWAAAPGRY